MMACGDRLMTFIQKIISPQEHEAFDGANKVPEKVRITATRNDLAAIADPATELVIWERSFPLNFQAWLTQLDASQLPSLRVLIKPADLRRFLELQMDNGGMVAGDMRDLLIGDIEELVFAYASITKSDLVDVRLERINHNACWKFHRDFVERRMLTTYLGPTTEWVHPQHATQAMCQQKCFKGPIENLALYDVAIFKGSCTGSTSGIVHRSPPIAGTGCTRLLLSLNEQSEISPDSWSEHL
jgi:hypothetical protein